MESNLNETILENIKTIREDFYKKNSKNRIFKEAQKQECAKYVSETIRLKDLISLTVFIIPDTNIIFYNYLIFKQYGHESNCPIIMEYFKKLITDTIERYGNFEIHFNLQTFSISALQRYSSIIQTAFDENIMFSEKMNRIVLYYTPHFIEMITTMFYKSIQTFIKRVEYVSKENSEKQIRIVYSNLTKK
jgi:hypothetical protein